MKTKPVTKHKSARPAVFLLLTLALAAPTLANVLAGSESAIGAGEHLAAAVAAAWVAVAFVGYMVDTYRAASLERGRHANERARQAPNR